MHHLHTLASPGRTQRADSGRCPRRFGDVPSRMNPVRSSTGCGVLHAAREVSSAWGVCQRGQTFSALKVPIR